MLKTPSDLFYWDSAHKLTTQSLEVLPAEIINNNADDFGPNYNQIYSVRLLGWNLELHGLTSLTNSYGNNGAGEYQNYKIGEYVLIQTTNGRLEDSVIIGTTYLRGEIDKFARDGQGLRFGETITGHGGNQVSANQPSMHPARITKGRESCKFSLLPMDGYKSIFTHPLRGNTVQSRELEYGIPSGLQYCTSDGLQGSYSRHNVTVADGGIYLISDGSKDSKCTAYLKAAERHKEIAAVLREINIGEDRATVSQEEEGLEFEIDQEIELEGLEISDNISLSEATFNVSSDFSFFDITTGKQVIENEGENIANTGDVNLSSSISETVSNLFEENELENETNNQIGNREVDTGARFFEAIARAEQHEKLAEINILLAEDCNKREAARQAQLAQMAQAVGGSLGSLSPNGLTGNVDPNNFTGRGEFPKPPVRFEQAGPENYDSRREHPVNRPTKIIVHQTNGSLSSAIATFKTGPVGEETSAHYIVARNGEIVQMVREDYRAYHAKPQGNLHSIGIEHVATNSQRGLTQAQEASTIKLIKYLASKYNLRAEQVFGHYVFVDTACPGLIWKNQAAVTAWAQKVITS